MPPAPGRSLLLSPGRTTSPLTCSAPGPSRPPCRVPCPVCLSALHLWTPPQSAPQATPAPAPALPYPLFRAAARSRLTSQLTLPLTSRSPSPPSYAGRSPSPEATPTALSPLCHLRTFKVPIPTQRTHWHAPLKLPLGPLRSSGDRHVGATFGKRPFSIPPSEDCALQDRGAKRPGDGRRPLSIPLWDDSALQETTASRSSSTNSRFNPTLGRLATSSGSDMGRVSGTGTFQSHSGTIGHFKEGIPNQWCQSQLVSIPLWDDWPLQVEVARNRRPDDGCFNPTLGRLATSSDCDMYHKRYRVNVSIPLWDDWPLQDPIRWEAPDEFDSFNPTLGRLATSRRSRSSV